VIGVRHRHLLAAAFAAASLLVIPAVAAASETVPPVTAGFSVRPVEVDPTNPLTRAYFILNVNRGAKLTRHVVVVNSGSAPVELLIYPVDGLTGTTSGDVYADRSDPRRFAGRWLQHATESINVPAYSHFVAPFTVVVPAHATPGDHLAGVAVEAAQRTTTGGHFSVTEVFREVVGVEMIVAGRAAPRIALRGAALAALPGTNYPSVKVRLANTGRDLCKPLLHVSLHGGGAASLSVSEQLDTVLPGTAIAFPFPLPHALAAGTYSISVAATECGAPARLHTMARLGTTLARTPASAVSTAAVVTAPSGGIGSLVPYIEFAIGGLGIGVLASRRRRHAPHA
jgi:hypothetical protein